MMATPNSDTKPTAAEMLKCVPVNSSAHRPPIDRSRTLDKTTMVSRKERKAMYGSTRIKPSDSWMMTSSLASPAVSGLA